jgi:hypothetical protein
MSDRMKKLVILFCLVVSMSLIASEGQSFPIDWSSALWNESTDGCCISLTGYSSRAVDYCFRGNGENLDWTGAQEKVKGTIDYVIGEVSKCGYTRGYTVACNAGLNEDQSLFKIIRKRAVDFPLKYGSSGFVVAILSVYVGYKLYSDIRARFVKQNKKS